MPLELRSFALILSSLVLTTTLAGGEEASRGPLPYSVAPDPREVHFSELRMLTDGGENAEAYFSFAGDRLVFQATRPGRFACDQILTIPVEGGEETLVSTGRGRTTCAYFLPGDAQGDERDDERIVYASTHLAGPECPPVPDRSQGYVWPLYEGYDLFVTRMDGSEPLRLTDTPGYDAEATVSPQRDRIVFTSVRDGDLELYTMKLDGSEVRRLTHTPGYDGGAFFSPDGSKIVWRASRPSSPAEEKRDRELLKQGLVRPGELEIFVMDADGSNQRQVTQLGGASFAPFFHPSGEKILFSSNHHSESGREFDLFMVDLDGSHLERLTWAEGFDGFPIFSPDGQWLAFSSNRSNRRPGETNVFVTRWREVAQGERGAPGP